MKPWRNATAAFGLFCLSFGTAQAEFPDRAIRLIVPYAAGGGTDVTARIIGQMVGEKLGVAVIVENRGGANGNIGASVVSHAAPDGYTLLFNTSSIILNPSLYTRNEIDPIKDFTPVTRISFTPLVLAVTPSLPVKNVNELVQYLRDNPGKLNYGSAGVGNITHLSSLMFLEANNLSATHIPYKGGGQAITDTIAGHTQFMSETVNSALPFVKSGGMRAVATTGPKRAVSLPDIPTLSETVAPGLEVGSWTGVLAPANTPSPIVDRLNKVFNEVLNDPATREKLEAMSTDPTGSTPQGYSDYIKLELDRWAKIIKAAGIKLD